MPDQVQTIAVVGAGQMGAGIAQVSATAGFNTLLFDASQTALAQGFASISKRLDRGVEKGTLSAADKSAIEKRITRVSALGELSAAGLVIEAIVEDASAKINFFKGIDSVCAQDAIFASNTSSVSITKLAAATKRPDKFIGLHFMNPVPVMQLIEVIRGLQTSDETYQSILALIAKLGKTPITAKRDYPGFIVNRILIPMLNEACFVLMEGISTVEEIDTAMKLGTNQPMGPLELADFVGLDTCLAICRIFHTELGEDKYRPCPLLVKYVEAGWLGKKTGRGFYQYK